MERFIHLKAKYLGKIDRGRLICETSDGNLIEVKDIGSAVIGNVGNIMFKTNSNGANYYFVKEG